MNNVTNISSFQFVLLYYSKKRVPGIICKSRPYLSCSAPFSRFSVPSLGMSHRTTICCQRNTIVPLWPALWLSKIFKIKLLFVILISSCLISSYYIRKYHNTKSWCQKLCDMFCHSKQFHIAITNTLKNQNCTI